MKKAAITAIVLLLCIAFCSCSGGQQGQQTDIPRDYPFLDDSGFWHYQIRLNGEVLPLKNDALIATESNKHNEIVYPLSEILDYFGVAYFWDKLTDDFTTVIDGISVSRDCKDENFMWFSNQPDGYGNSVKPRSINGVFYAPNFVFEHTIGARLTKISKGAEESIDCIDITTEGGFVWGGGSSTIDVMRWNGKKYVGSKGNSSVVVNPGGSTGGDQACLSCHGAGIKTCSACGGSGGSYAPGAMGYDPATGTMKQGPMTFKRCTSCNGGGQQTCPSCGGSGKR